MMLQIPAEQASHELEQLLHQVAKGQGIVIIGSDGLAYKLTVLPRLPQPVFGSARGLIHLQPDFDDPIEGFEAYLP